nr:EOG090X01QX [Leptodora kindtii]
MPPKSPDLIELSDTGPSPLLSLEDDSSPPLTDVDSEDPQCDTESPTPTNSAASIDPQNYWQGTEEHRELLATEGEEDDDDEEDEQNLEGDKQIELVEISSSESDAGSSANHSSNSDAGNSYTNDVEEIDEEELWKISSEQLAYYKGQFKTLQPDPSGLLGGSQAKQFFEKSRLPLTELSRIWKLSDVTKDGALSLSEFCTAMHLVVLRRNNIALPNQLPPLLDPVNMFSNGSSSSGSGGVTQVDGGDKVVEGPSQTWIEFVDSPTGSVTSPGPRPVNFDFQRAQVEQNPRILHPVALRLTPESQSVDLASGPISLPPCGPNLGNSLINAASNNTISNLGGKKEPPPPPPPRPYRGHTRSSSLDLNQLVASFNRGQGRSILPLTFFFVGFQAPKDFDGPSLNAGCNLVHKFTKPSRLSASYNVTNMEIEACCHLVLDQGQFLYDLPFYNKGPRDSAHFYFHVVADVKMRERNYSYNSLA